MTRHLQREIDKLKDKLLNLSGLVERSLQLAVVSIEQRDTMLAKEVIEGDEEIDTLEVDIEEECLKILALHQPIATDLRFIIAILKMNNDLERIGDLTVNMAERSIYLAEKEAVGIPFDFSGMARKAQSMLRDSLEALVNQDVSLACHVCAEDAEVDKLHREVYEKVESAMREYPKHLDYLIPLLTVARHLERIADHATNIAEDVIYLVEGEIPRHKMANFTDRCK